MSVHHTMSSETTTNMAPKAIATGSRRRRLNSCSGSGRGDVDKHAATVGWMISAAVLRDLRACLCVTV
ncbi:MAG: hypothetical protein WD276_02185 [Actinomycetota bacterium]